MKSDSDEMLCGMLDVTVFIHNPKQGEMVARVSQRAEVCDIVEIWRIMAHVFRQTLLEGIGSVKLLVNMKSDRETERKGLEKEDQTVLPFSPPHRWPIMA